MSEVKIPPTATMTMRVEHWRGGVAEKVVNLSVPDIRAFKNTAVYPWLVMAANPHLTVADIARILTNAGTSQRPAAWIQKRRWMTRKATPQQGNPTLDGKREKAIQVMSANRKLSLRELTRLLKANGIVRGKDWVRQHRCDCVAVGLQTHK